MNQNYIENIKKRAKFIQIVLRIAIIGIVIFYAICLIATVFLFFKQQASFSAIKGNDNWGVSYAISNLTNISISIPFNIIQPTTPFDFSAKNAFIAYCISILIFNLPIILFGIKQLLGISTSTVSGSTPFTLDNAIKLKKLGYSIIIYNVATDLLFNIICAIFVTKQFFVNYSNIFNINGILAGVLILVISGIFKYGIYLQNEYDATL